jgi:hypothetical protein
MSQYYLFPEPGSVPGIPGLFCGVRVDVADDGSFEVSPLPQHPHFSASPPEEEEATEEALPKRKKQAKAVSIESEV